MYPFNVISWVKILLVSGIMSVCLGGVFVGTRWRFWDDTWQKEPEFEQYNIADRVGFHHVMLVVGVWPTLLHLATDIWAGQEPVHRDLQDKLYSKFAYLITKVKLRNFECIDSAIFKSLNLLRHSQKIMNSLKFL